MDELQGIGVAGIFIILVLREVGAIIKKQREPKTDNSKAYDALFKVARETQQLTQALFDVHLGPNALDDDGAPKWYVRAALPESMEKLATSLDALADTMKELHRDNGEIRRDLAKLVNEGGA